MPFFSDVPPLIPFSTPQDTSSGILNRPLRRSACLLWLMAITTACGPSTFRLDGSAPAGVAAVALLDTTAFSLLDSLKGVYALRLADLQRSSAARFDSLTQDAANSGDRLRTARAAYSERRSEYRLAFKGLGRFRSFGGNPVFSDADAEVATGVLMEEIADRFYKGKAFSLETEAEIRRFIRSRLVSKERAVRRSRAAVLQARRSETGASKAKEDLRTSVDQEYRELRSVHNDAIREALVSAIRHTAVTDSSGSFLFGRVSEASYVLYATDAHSSSWLIPVPLQGHRRQDLTDLTRRMVLIPSPNCHD